MSPARVTCPCVPVLIKRILLGKSLRPTRFLEPRNWFMLLLWIYRQLEGTLKALYHLPCSTASLHSETYSDSECTLFTTLPVCLRSCLPVCAESVLVHFELALWLKALKPGLSWEKAQLVKSFRLWSAFNSHVFGALKALWWS